MTEPSLYTYQGVTEGYLEHQLWEMVKQHSIGAAVTAAAREVCRLHQQHAAAQAQLIEVQNNWGPRAQHAAGSGSKEKAMTLKDGDRCWLIQRGIEMLPSLTGPFRAWVKPQLRSWHIEQDTQTGGCVVVQVIPFDASTTHVYTDEGSARQALKVEVAAWIVSDPRTGPSFRMMIAESRALIDELMAERAQAKRQQAENERLLAELSAERDQVRLLTLKLEGTRVERERVLAEDGLLIGKLVDERDEARRAWQLAQEEAARLRGDVALAEAGIARAKAEAAPFIAVGKLFVDGTATSDYPSLATAVAFALGALETVCRVVAPGGRLPHQRVDSNPAKPLMTYGALAEAFKVWALDAESHSTMFRNLLGDLGVELAPNIDLQAAARDKIKDWHNRWGHDQRRLAEEMKTTDSLGKALDAARAEQITLRARLDSSLQARGQYLRETNDLRATLAAMAEAFAHGVSACVKSLGRPDRPMVLALTMPKGASPALYGQVTSGLNRLFEARGWRDVVIVLADDVTLESVSMDRLRDLFEQLKPIFGKRIRTRARPNLEAATKAQEPPETAG